MIKATAYAEGVIVAGAGTDLNVFLAAPWVGIVKTVLVHFIHLPAAGDELVFSLQNKNLDPDHRTQLFSEDPNLCNTQDFTLLSPVSMQAGDRLTIEYANAANVGIRWSITLETS